MRIVFETEELKECVKVLEKGNKSKENPYVRMRSSEDKLIMGTSDGTSTVEIGVFAEVDEVVDFQVNKDVFIGLVKRMKGEKTEINSNGKTLKLSSEANDAYIPFSEEITKYVSVDTEDVEGVNIDAAELLDGLNKVAYAAEFGPGMGTNFSGVIWNFKPEGIEFAATDGFRMAWSRIKNTTGEANLSFMVPIFNLEMVKRIIREYRNEPCMFWGLGNKVVLKIANVYMSIRLLDSKLFDYEKILLTQNTECKAEVDRGELMRVLDFTEVITSASIEGEQAIIVRLDDDRMYLGVENESGKSNNTVDVLLEGRFICKNTGFYGSNILDVLKRADMEKITLTLGSDDSPMIMQENNPEIEWKAYVMPVRLRSGLA